MARPDFSEVTQDEVESLFNEDGPLEEEPEAAEEDSGEEEPAEAEETQEEAESSDSEGDEAEGEEPEEEPEVNWQERAERSERDSRKLQSELTKRSNAYKEIERSLPQLRSKADTLDRLNSLFGQHPELQRAFEREIAKVLNPAADIEVPKGLENDPAIQYSQRVLQYARGLEGKVASYEQRLGKLDQWENQSIEATNKAKLDGLLDEAKAEIKTMFGRDATEQELTRVLEYMVDKNYYESGGTVAFHVFRDQYRKLSTRASSEKARQKANKFPVRKKGINPSRMSGKSRDAGSPEEAIAMALADQGAF